MLKKIALISLVTFTGISHADTSKPPGGGDYSVIDRFVELEDKFETYEMMNRYGHDFIFDVAGYLNKNLVDLMDEASEISKIEDQNQQITEANKLLAEYDNTEQTMRVKVLMGIPLPSFKIKKVKFVPDFRFGVNAGAHVGIKSDEFSVEDMLSFVDQDQQDAFAPYIDAVVSNGLTTTQINTAINNNNGDLALALKELDTTHSLGFTPTELAILSAAEGSFFVPELAEREPVIHAYGKLDAHAGFLFNYYAHRWYGFFKIYGNSRTDLVTYATAESIANDADLLTGLENKNTTNTLNLDYKLGYRSNRYAVYAQIEDIKLATISDNEAEGGPLKYDISPLYRLHGDVMFKTEHFSLKPFAGLHKRKQYDFVDGIYGGADFGGHIFRRKIGLRVRAMLDNEHFTFSPKFKFGIGHLEYVLKMPFASEKDGMKVSAMHGANFRLFF